MEKPFNNHQTMFSLIEAICGVSARVLIVLAVVKLFEVEIVRGGPVPCLFKPCSINGANVLHTLCDPKYPAQLKKEGNCKSKDSKTLMTAALKEAILDRHNERRMTLGKDMANMRKLKWDDELSKSAVKFLNSCPNVTEHDTCRYLERFASSKLEVNQNSASLKSKIKKKKPDQVQACKDAVDVWFDKGKSLKPKDKDKLTLPVPDKDNLAYYATVAWADTALVGCGYLEYGDAESRYLLVCNYFPGFPTTEKQLYQKGKPCSKCPKKTQCSKVYPGLCTDEKEIIPPKKKKSAGNPTFESTSWFIIFSILTFRNWL